MIGSDIFVYPDHVEQVTMIVWTEAPLRDVEVTLGMVKGKSVDSRQGSKRSDSEEGSIAARSKMEEILRRRLDSAKGQVGIAFATVK